MVLQKLIQDGHLEVRESLIDMNNTVLKVRFWLKMSIIVQAQQLPWYNCIKLNLVKLILWFLGCFISFLASLSHHVQ